MFSPAFTAPSTKAPKPKPPAASAARPDSFPTIEPIPSVAPDKAPVKAWMGSAEKALFTLASLSANVFFRPALSPPIFTRSSAMVPIGFLLSWLFQKFFEGFAKVGFITGPFFAFFTLPDRRNKLRRRNRLRQGFSEKVHDAGSKIRQHIFLLLLAPGIALKQGDEFLRLQFGKLPWL